MSLIDFPTSLDAAASTNNTSIADRNRLLFMRWLTYLALGLCTVGILLTIGFAFSNEDGLQDSDIEVIAAQLVIVVCSIITIVLINRPKPLLQSGANTLLVGYVVTFFLIESHSTSLVVALLAISTAAIMSHRWIFFGINGIIVTSLFIDLFGYLPDPDAGGNDGLVARLIVQIVALGIVNVVLRFFVHTSDKTVGESQRSTELLQAASEVGQRMTEVLDINTVFDQSVNLIRERLGYYHVQVFLIDDARAYANLVASTGTAGQRLIERNHRLAVGSQSVIGKVYRTKDVVIARARSLDSSSIHARNELLPETRAELALPILDAGVIIGVLDVQSTHEDAFNTVEIQTLQVIASQLSVAIRNANLFQEQNRSAEQNRRLADQEREAAQEVERLNERLTGRAWTEYLRDFTEDNALEMDFSDDSGTIVPIGDWTESLQEATEINHFVQSEQDDKQIFAIPLRVRGQVIGAMEFELEPGQSFSPEDFDMLQEISERFGLAAENARLVDESQRVAQREALVNQISSRIQMENNVEKTINEAVRGLKDSLKAERVTILLGTPPAQS